MMGFILPTGSYIHTWHRFAKLGIAPSHSGDPWEFVDGLQRVVGSTCAPGGPRGGMCPDAPSTTLSNGLKLGQQAILAIISLEVRDDTDKRYLPKATGSNMIINFSHIPFPIANIFFIYDGAGYETLFHYCVKEFNTTVEGGSQPPQSLRLSKIEP
jgi:hypothetical protein